MQEADDRSGGKQDGGTNMPEPLCRGTCSVLSASGFVTICLIDLRLRFTRIFLRIAVCCILFLGK